MLKCLQLYVENLHIFSLVPWFNNDFFRRGNQQYDSLRPSLLCLNTQLLLSSLNSDSAIDYIYDITISGYVQSVHNDVKTTKLCGVD